MYELESKSTIASDMKELVDCAAGFMSAASSWLSSGLSAGRLYGDKQQHLGGRQERSTSATDKIDKIGWAG